MRRNRYPRIQIRSNTELARHISDPGYSREKAARLIRDVAANFSKYWKDNISRSKPEENKYVRSAKGTPLGLLLERLNIKVLAPHDHRLPNFVFGGVRGTSHVDAALNLLGAKRKRTLLKMDISRFFEQNDRERVEALLHDKFGCSRQMARRISYLTCVQMGSKGASDGAHVLARGFATSTRLAVWCNLGLFEKLERLVRERLNGKDPRISIYVDDIGITASRVTEAEMEALATEAKKLLLTGDPNHGLPLNEKKKRITSHVRGMEILGVRLERNRLDVGNRTRGKEARVLKALHQTEDAKERRRLSRHLRGIRHYKNYVKRAAPKPAA